LAIRIASRQAQTLTGEVDGDSLGDLVFAAGKKRPITRVRNDQIAIDGHLIVFDG